jgi:hypothetical protein
MSPDRSAFSKNRLLVYAIVLAAVFLLGFVPQYVKANRLSREVQTLAWQNQMGTARDLIGIVFLDVANNNFGIASRDASTFFNHIRQMLDRATDPGERDALQQISARRDSVTAALAKADPAVRIEVQEIFTQMHQIQPPPLTN